MSARLANVGVAAVVGVVAAHAAGPVAVATVAAVVALTLRRWLPRSVLVLVAVVALAALAAAREGGRPAVPDGAVPDDRGDDQVEGWVSGPRTALADATGLVVDTGATAVWVTVPGAPAVWPGDRVRVVGKLMRPRGFRDPGSPDRVQIARDRGAAWELAATSIEVSAAADRPSAWRWPAQRAARWSRWIADRGGDATGNALIRGLVVGDRSAIEPATDAAWRAAGVYHALSVSGLHLAVVALFAFAVARRALAYVPAVAARVAPRRAAAAVALPLAVGYTLVTGGQVATVRALVVVGVMLAGELCERRARTVDALGAAAVVAIGARPSVVFDPGFQLSFVAAATLIAVAQGRPPATGPRWRRALAALGGAVRVSWAVTLTTAPITAWHFGEVALGGVIGNLFVGPALELLALPVALVGAVLGGLSSTVGGALIDLAVVVAALTARAVAALAAWTPSLRVRAPTALEVAAMSTLAAAWVAARRGRGGRAVAAVAAVAALVLAASWWRHAGRPATPLRVTFLDVGQGDAAVIEFPTGEVWLIDAGGAAGAQSRRGQLAPGRAVVGFLQARGVRAVDLAVVSHPHPDHYLGLVAVAAVMPIRALWDVDDRAVAAEPSAVRAKLPSYAAVRAALVATGTRPVAPALGLHWVGDVAVEVLAPRGIDPAAPTAAIDPVRTVNDNSLVLRVSRGGAAVLFAGDLEEEGEQALVDAGLAPTTVVKVPHHGSPTSSTAALVAAARPRWAVVSLGRANRFRFPSPAVIARWEAVGATVLRTDQVGAVTAEVAADGQVRVRTFDRPPGQTPTQARVILAR
ncbi:MAG: DNA internalization-related competence protein ComEC/Rec2 [Kofleriaceae bacterium]